MSRDPIDPMAATSAGSVVRDAVDAAASTGMAGADVIAKAAANPATIAAAASAAAAAVRPLQRPLDEAIGFPGEMLHDAGEIARNLPEDTQQRILEQAQDILAEAGGSNSLKALGAGASVAGAIVEVASELATNRPYSGVSRQLRPSQQRLAVQQVRP